MAQTDNDKKPTSRERLLARARERYADRTFADIGAEPQEGVADLDDAIEEMLEEYATRQSTYEDNNARLVELLNIDPAAAEFLQRWIETKEPRTALIEVFGDDLGLSQEAQGKFAEQLEGWRQRKAENDALEKESTENWDASLAALEEWGNARQLSMEQKRDVMVKLLGIVANGMVNKYGAEDFDLAYNAINHDSDVAAARQEGEVTGRNERIAAARRGRAAMAGMPPAPTGRQGGRVADPQPKKPKSPWAGIE